MSDCKESLHLINPVIDNEVGTALEVFDLKLNTHRVGPLAALRAVLSITNSILRLLSMSLSYFVLSGFFCRVVVGSTRRHGKTGLASVEPELLEKQFPPRTSAKCDAGVG